jgi:hypothetical protein
LPTSNIGWTRNALGELIWRIQFFILDELAESLRTLLVVVKFQEAKFGWADSGADELIDLALVFGIEEELSILTDMLLELLLELNDMFQDKFLLGSVLSIRHSWALLLLKLSAALELFIDDVLPPLEEL